MKKNNTYYYNDFSDQFPWFSAAVMAGFQSFISRVAELIDITPVNDADLPKANMYFLDF